MNFKPYILAVKEILLSSCKNEESLPYIRMSTTGLQPETTKSSPHCHIQRVLIILFVKIKKKTYN